MSPISEPAKIKEMKNEALLSLSKDELIDLIEMYSKNWSAMDGVWFQSVEQKLGMDEAMYHDCEAWKRYTVIEARRIKAFLGLTEHPGIEGLKKALHFRFYAHLNDNEYINEDESMLVYRCKKCRVQAARLRKGLELHPCKTAAVFEYAGFAATIDSRITCECVSCYPDVTDEQCSCAWRFRLDR